MSESEFVYSDLNIQYFKTWKVPKIGKKSEWVYIPTLKFQNSIMQIQINLENPYNRKIEWVSLHFNIQISKFNDAKHGKSLCNWKKEWVSLKLYIQIWKFNIAELGKSLKSENRVSESLFVYSNLNIQYCETWKIPKIGKKSECVFISAFIYQYWIDIAPLFSFLH